MKPRAFDYECPDSIAEALVLLKEHAGSAKIIAGGQSLMPMLNFRVVSPALLVDIQRLLELDYLTPLPDGGLEIGALTRHRVLETSSLVAHRFPVISEGMRHVAHVAIRNRGTIGGSLAHADPAAELPMLAMLLDARIVAASPRGQRTIAAGDFFIGSLANALQDDEIVVRIELPGLAPGTGWAFEEFARRRGDFALAAVGILLHTVHGKIDEARIAMMGVGGTPLRLRDAERLLIGCTPDDAVFNRAIAAACDSLQPTADLHASPEYRIHLAGVLTRRALHSAWQRAGDGKP
jgi:carbon-monoxide dehydrogenase medium subunit